MGRTRPPGHASRHLPRKTRLFPHPLKARAYQAAYPGFILLAYSLFIRYTRGMQVGGYNKEPDWVRLGPSLLIASCVILAIRTAKWAARTGQTNSERDLEVEIDHSIHLAGRVLGVLVSRKANLFPSKDVPWYVADDADEPK